MAKELAEMDTAAGKEADVQDSQEHAPFNSMAASEINGDVGIKKQGEESEDETLPAAKTHCQVRPHHIWMTMPNEVPEMDTAGKEDGESEHVAFNSMAASEVHGDVGIKNPGEDSKQGTHPVAIGDVGIKNPGVDSKQGTHPVAIGAPAGSSYLHPLVLEDSESDSEDQAWINHPSLSPEDSVLHAGAGCDNMAVPESEMQFEQTHPNMGDMQTPFRVGDNITVADIIRRRNMGERQRPFEDGMTVHEFISREVLARRKYEVENSMTVRQLIRTKVHARRTV